MAAASLGEWRFGAGEGCANLLSLTVSTGVGGGSVIDGRPYRGADGMAGEIGHVDIVPVALGDDTPLWGAIALAGRLLTDNV